MEVAAPLPPAPPQPTPSRVPENANEGCVGPAAEEAGKVEGCAGCPNRAACASGKGREVDPGEWSSCELWWWMDGSVLWRGCLSLIVTGLHVLGVCGRLGMRRMGATVRPARRRSAAGRYPRVYMIAARQQRRQQQQQRVVQ